MSKIHEKNGLKTCLFCKSQWILDNEKKTMLTPYLLTNDRSHFMKNLIILFAIFLLATQSHAAQCMSKATLDANLIAIKGELEGQLTTQALGILNALKVKVPADTYARLQTEKTALGPVEAVQIEAVLAEELQSIATGLDKEAVCYRGDSSERSSIIHWECDSITTHLSLNTNYNNTFFSVTLVKERGDDKQSPISYTSSATALESRNVVRTDHFISLIKFKGSRYVSGINIHQDDDFDQFAIEMAAENQRCQ